MKLRLLTKFLLFILFPALVGLCVIGGLAYLNASKTVDDLISQELNLIVERQRSELGNIMALQQNALRFAGSNTAIAELLAAQKQSASPEIIQALVPAAGAVLTSLNKEFPLFGEVCLLDARGNVLYHNNAQLIGMDFSSRAYFKDAMQGRMGIQSLRSTLDNKSMSTIIAVPLRSPKGDIWGVVYGNLDISVFSQNTTNAARFGQTGICYVYDSNGVMIMHPNADYIGDEDGSNDWTRMMLDQKDGNLRYVWNNRVKLAYFRAVADTNWIVVMAVDRDEAIQPIGHMLWTIGLVAGACILIVGLFIFFTARDITITLRQGATFVGQVASGDLNISDAMSKQLHAACNRGDEIGLLASGIGRMVSNLSLLLSDSRRQTETAKEATEAARLATLQAEKATMNAENAKSEGMLHAAECLDQVVTVLSSASSRLDDQIEKSEHGAGQQAARITETATAMEEMNSTVLEVAKNAGIAADVAAGARTRAEAGTIVVQKAVSSIKDVQHQAVQLKRDMEVLGESAHSISQIMNVISDIADQTNLLALNAAIEAARAGDAGRGFAVVADEVRKLAEKTMASTTDVGNAIKAIQDNTAKSIAQMDAAVKTIEDATSLSVQSGEALVEIVGMVDQAADQVRAIATAAEEQSASSEAISRSIVHINTIAGETTRTMHESAETVSEVSRQSTVLGDLMRELKRG